MITALVMDWETTGLILHPDTALELQPRVIEFGGVVIDEDGETLAQHSFIINPGIQVEPIITKITGLTNDDLAPCEPFAFFLPELRKIYASVDVLIAHNLPFDKGMLELELRRQSVTDFVWPRFMMCTVQAYVEQWGRRPKLTQLYEKVMGKPLAQTHRALDDCRALAEIVIKEKLLNEFATVAPAHGIQLPNNVRPSKPRRKKAK